MHISQSIDQQSYRTENVCHRKSGKYAEIRAIDELLAKERNFSLCMKFERAHDVRMHQADVGLPFRAQLVAALLVAICDFERDRRACKSVLGEPRMCIAIAAQPADERVSIG